LSSIPVLSLDVRQTLGQDWKDKDRYDRSSRRAWIPHNTANLFERLVVIPQGTPLIESYQMVGPIIIVGGFLFFLGSALIPSILAYIGDKASREFRGSAMGLYSVMLSGGITTGTILAGIADDLGGVQ